MRISETLPKQTLVEKFQKRYDIGFPIFEKLFQLKKDDFIKVMKNIFQDNKDVMSILENTPVVMKTLRNDEPDTITLHFYGSISLDYHGVKYVPEHGSSTEILKFDKFFNIAVALEVL
jgi:hypothetical protein